MKKIKVPAPAKLNLFLDVTGKRENGYHEIDSIMQSVSLCDELDIEINNGEGIGVICASPFAPSGEGNIVWRAADKYLSENKIKASLKIELTKVIPSPAGMGGGSADAAALLRALNEHFEAMSYEELVSLAVKIGSDVPFCLKNGTQRVRGLGDHLECIHDFPSTSIFVIAVSGEDVPTPAAYKALDRKYNDFIDYRPTRSSETLISAINEADIGSACSRMFNIFEDTVLPLCPKASSAREALLKHGALGAMMSGSGSSVFGIFNENDRDKADYAVRDIAQNGISAHIATAFPKSRCQ